MSIISSTSVRRKLYTICYFLLASEPNLLKVRLKQRVMERRCSPMSKRLPPSLKKKLLSSCLPPSDSPPQEPPKELSPPCESEEYQRHMLFSSPSMPNISLAAHHVLSPDLSEAAVRAACTARLGEWRLPFSENFTFHC